MVALKDSEEARFWFLHVSAVSGAALLGFVIGPRLVPFLALLLCRPLVGILLSLLPLPKGRSYRPYLLGGALLLAGLAHLIPVRGSLLYVLVMVYLLCFDVVLDSLVVKCCPQEEWVGKTAGLGFSRCVGLPLGLVASGLAWPSAPWWISANCLLLAGLWTLCSIDSRDQGAGPGGIRGLAATGRHWFSSPWLISSGLWLVAGSLLAGMAGTSLFPLLVLDPSNVARQMADPWQWLGSGLLWVMLALVMERQNLRRLLRVTLSASLFLVWLGGPLKLWPEAVQLTLGLACLSLYRVNLTAQTERVDPILRTSLPLTLWVAGQLAGERVVVRWAEMTLPVTAFCSVVLLWALHWAFRRGLPAEQAGGRDARRPVVSVRHGDRTFDFEAAPLVGPKRRSRQLSKLWHFLTVRFPVSFAIVMVSSFLLAGVWHVSAQRQSWKAKTTDAWLAFQTELFVSRLKVRLEEEMLASSRVPSDWASFVGSSFQLEGRPLKAHDFWGTRLRFEDLPEKVRIVSAGSDAKFFTTDDIVRTADKPAGVR